MDYIAYCTKGLEHVVEKELLTTFNNIVILEKGDKRITFQFDGNPQELTALHTVDDIGLLVWQIDNCVSLQEFFEVIKKIDFRFYQQIIQQFRPVTNSFSITTSIVGSNIKPKKIIPHIVSFFEQSYQWTFTEFDHTNFDIRIFADRKKWYVSIRLAKESLHHRLYKIISRLGSLKPSVAAAMVLLATNGEKGKKIVDNFCGSGTILCEALLMHHEVFGGDKEPEAVAYTKTNVCNISKLFEDRIKLLDATHTSWPTNSFDCAISNLPWDKQIEVVSITDLYRKTLEEYKRILKSHATICLLVSKPDLLIKHAKKVFVDAEISGMKIGLLGQNPTIVVIRY